MHPPIPAYGSRQASRLTVAPVASEPLTLNSDLQSPFIAILANTSTTGNTTATTTVRIVDGGIALPLGINGSDTLEPGKTGTVAFRNGTRQLTGRHPLLNATPGYGFAVAGILAPADIASSPSQIRMFA